MTTNAPAPHDYTGSYGPTWTTGILTERLYEAEQAGLLVHRTASGRLYVTGPRGGAAVPVLCSELVDIYTEDGPMTGRCGAPAVETDIDGERVAFGCPGHTNLILSWRSER